MNNKFDINGNKVELTIETMQRIYTAYREFMLEDYWGEVLRKEGKELTKEEKDKFFSDFNERIEDDDYLSSEICEAERDIIREMCSEQNLEIID